MNWPTKPNFKEKTVLVTGGSLGIGRCIAAAFAKAGASVFIGARNQHDLDSAAAEMIKEGWICKADVVDVSCREAVGEWIHKIHKKEGSLDIVVNCAGILGPIGNLDSLDLNQWEETLRVNLWGTVYASYFSAPIMKKQRKGKIINLSGAGVGGPLLPNFTAYSVSKAAVVAFTEVLAGELAPYNVQVNAIAPGIVATRIIDQIIDAGESAGKEYLERTLQQKKDGGTPPELAADLALFLAGDAASFITGKLISAKWDPWRDFLKSPNTFTDSSLGNLRRIDNFKFYEKTKG